ncbi:hypothetical protein RchiOBHm_Chr5g0057901 [Rosa chinensis]|uniref:Uncharacterized protein n=1 Tax=Rosa chinensis TaxID=74649 RepID=A0A2P6QH09_ROSCH|nr:hypothetical protein RchiOBHm_Chr5g0057901 [Rosa chinensis]
MIVAIESLRPARGRLKMMNVIMKMMRLRNLISIWDTKMTARQIDRWWNIWTQIGSNVARCEAVRSVNSVKRLAIHQSLGGTLDSRVVMKDWNENPTEEELRSEGTAAGRLLSRVHGTTEVGTPIGLNAEEWVSSYGGVPKSFWKPKSVGLGCPK